MLLHFDVFGVLFGLIAVVAFWFGIQLCWSVVGKPWYSVAGRVAGAVALIGLVLGVAAALGLTRLMATLLFDVRPNDPLTFSVVALTLTATALVASWAPALKAARVDPLTALRHE